MNKKEALDYIKLYQDNPPQPTIEYYQDSYRDGYQDASGYFVKYPPMDPKLIDAILERDKDCKEYIPDCDCDVDEKFNQEMEKRFTDLMSRAKDTVIEEYRKKNSRFYSMSTKVNDEYITVIPMQYMTEVEFKEKASAASETLQLSNYHIYLHLNEDDKKGCEIFKSFPLHSSYISDADRNTFDNVIRLCNKFEKYAKDYKSQNKELINNLCDDIKENIENLYRIINADYLQRINNYIAKEQEVG